MRNEFTFFIVHIENVENNVPKGWFMNPYVQEFVTFTDLGDMVLKMDESLHQLMDQEEQGEPGNLTCYHSHQNFAFHSKPQFFYLIQILHTSYHSWQGLVTGTNRPRIAFKSTLDCIRKIDQSMQGKQPQRIQA